jgi:uncharacterized protein (TIGR03435 family)
MLSRFKAVAWIVGLLLPLPGFAQQTPSGAAFEVATIKPVDPAARFQMIGVMDTPDGIDGEDVTLAMLMQKAYGYLKFSLDEQVTGVPEWAKSQRYNVHAKMSEDDALELQKLSREERGKRIETMLQSLLAERFKLTIHRATKQIPDYELVIAKSGFKLTPVSDDSSAIVKDTKGNPIKDAKGNPITGRLVLFNGKSAIFQKESMDEFAETLTHMAEVGKLVVNKTGLSGKYSFTLPWLLPGSVPRPTEADDARSIFSALQEDLGLRLQPSKGEVEILVIDHAEPPTEN